MTLGIDRLQIENWMRRAGDIALATFDQAETTYKTDGTPVTQADHRIEAFLVSQIQRAYPSHGILAEEGTTVPGSDDLWVLDPLDGTRAYSAGLPLWGIAIGLLHHQRPVLGAYYMPYVRELYWATEGEAPTLNDRSLQGRILADWAERSAFLAVPSNAHRAYQITYPRTRAFGSTLAHVAYLVRGAAIGVLTRRLHIWDLAASLPLLWAAGATLTTLSGRPLDLAPLLDGRPAPEPLVAAHPAVIDRLRGAITEVSGRLT